MRLPVHALDSQVEPMHTGTTAVMRIWCACLCRRVDSQVTLLLGALRMYGCAGASQPSG